MPESFTRKSIETQIILAQGDFGSGNTRTIRGLATQADIMKPGGDEKGSCKVKIWGLQYADLEKLTALSFKALESQKNLIRVSAGEESGRAPVLPVCFAGEITTAVTDFNQAPDVPLEIEAKAGFYPQRVIKPPLSVRGEASVAALLEQQALEAGYTFKNEGVTGSLRNCVISGSPIEKAEKIARQAGVELIIDDNQLIAIPPGGNRTGAGIPFLTARTGLEGYPTFNQDGIVCKCLYRPDLQLGGLVKVESIVPRASGTWKITKLSHHLVAYKPDGGPWQSRFEGMFTG
jgi:hypothetical protein